MRAGSADVRARSDAVLTDGTQRQVILQADLHERRNYTSIEAASQHLCAASVSATREPKFIAGINYAVRALLAEQVSPLVLSHACLRRPSQQTCARQD